MEKPANKLNGKGISAKASGTLEARDTARLLLEIEAIHCRPDNPYIFTSGRASPVYIDCRKIISFPEARAKIMQHAFKMIDKTGRDIRLQVDGGVDRETARLCVAAGADVLVAGTATFRGGPECYAANIAALKAAD